MIKITAKALLPGLFFLLLSAAPLGGCMGTYVSSGEMDQFTPGVTTAAEVEAALGKPVATDGSEGEGSAFAIWNYLITQQSVDELESYLDEDEDLEQLVDLSKYLHKKYMYVGAALVPFPVIVTFATASLFVFDPDGILVQKDRIDWTVNGSDVYSDSNNAAFEESAATAAGLSKKYLNMYEADDVAKVKEELLRIKASGKKKKK